MNKVEKAFKEITNSNLCLMRGKEIDLAESIIELCKAIKATEEVDWNLGELGLFTLSDFIAGSYWALSELHGGQYTAEYEALCCLGEIYTPSILSLGAEIDCGEWDAYELCCQYAFNQVS